MRPKKYTNRSFHTPATSHTNHNPRALLTALQQGHELIRAWEFRQLRVLLQQRSRACQVMLVLRLDGHHQRCGRGTDGPVALGFRGLAVRDARLRNSQDIPSSGDGVLRPLGPRRHTLSRCLVQVHGSCHATIPRLLLHLYGMPKSFWVLGCPMACCDGCSFVHSKEYQSLLERNFKKKKPRKIISCSIFSEGLQKGTLPLCQNHTLVHSQQQQQLSSKFWQNTLRSEASDFLCQNCLF